MSRFATLLETCIEMLTDGYTVIPVSHDDQEIDIQFNTMADVTTQLSEANRTLGLHSLAIIPYDVMAILVTVDEFELFETVTLRTSENCPVYLFKRPKNLRFAKAVTLDNEYLSDFEYFADIESRKSVGMRAMLITSVPIHFTQRVDKNNELAYLPAEFSRFINNEPAKRDKVGEFGSMYTRFDINPLLLKNKPNWEKILTGKYKKKPNGNKIAQLEQKTLNEGLLTRVSKLINISNVSLLDLVQFNTHELLVNNPSCLLYYGSESTLSISFNGGPPTDIIMRQGDLFMGTDMTVLVSFERKCAERSAFLFLES